MGGGWKGINLAGGRGRVGKLSLKLIRKGIFVCNALIYLGKKDISIICLSLWCWPLLNHMIVGVRPVCKLTVSIIYINIYMHTQDEPSVSKEWSMLAFNPSTMRHSAPAELHVSVQTLHRSN